jgi:hypothetical protein
MSKGTPAQKRIDGNAVFQWGHLLQLLGLPDSARAETVYREMDTLRGALLDIAQAVGVEDSDEYPRNIVAAVKGLVDGQREITF